LKREKGLGGIGWRASRRPKLGVPLDDPVEIVFKAIADGDDLFTDIDLVAGDGVDVGDGNDIGAVDADEFFGWKFEREGFQVVQCKDGFGPSFYIDLGIVFHPFAEQDIFEIDLNDLVFGFDKDEAVIPAVDIDGGGKVVTDLVHSRKEAFKGEGPVEETEDIHLRYFFVLFLFVGDANDDRVIAGFLKAKHDAVIEEADVPENDIGAELGDQLIDIGGGFAAGGKGEVRDLGDIFFQQGSLFVVIFYHDAVQCAHHGNTFYRVMPIKPCRGGRSHAVN
jgi:hypothetical protein